MAEQIYDKFFVNGESFTVEDYGNGFALYCEDCFAGELASPDHRAAYALACAYQQAR